MSARSCLPFSHEGLKEFAGAHDSDILKDLEGAKMAIAANQKTGRRCDGTLEDPVVGLILGNGGDPLPWLNKAGDFLDGGHGLTRFGC